jgi:BolA family transcriptional regulator, general stress-responsive regulator
VKKISAAEIQILLQAYYPDARITVIDDSAKHAHHREAKASGGHHFQARIISPAFEGKSLTTRHRAVYKILKDHMGSSIHALALETLSPTEAIKKNCT